MQVFKRKNHLGSKEPSVHFTNKEEKEVSVHVNSKGATNIKTGNIHRRKQASAKMGIFVFTSVHRLYACL